MSTGRLETHRVRLCSLKKGVNAAHVQVKRLLLLFPPSLALTAQRVQDVIAGCLDVCHGEAPGSGCGPHNPATNNTLPARLVSLVMAFSVGAAALVVGWLRRCSHMRETLPA